MRLLVSTVPGGDSSAVRVTSVANNALVLSLAQLPESLIDAATMVREINLLEIAGACHHRLKVALNHR